MALDKNLHWKESCGKPFMGAEDIPADKDVPLKIIDMNREEVYCPKEKKKVVKTIMTFEGHPLRFIPGIVQSEQLFRAIGLNNMKQWTGHTVTLFRTVTEKKHYGGGKPCIRIRTK